MSPVVADCLRMIVRAEMRMVDELDKKPSAQGRRTDIVRGSDEVVTLDDLGLDRRRVAEWREVRDAGEAAITEALAEVLAPTKADIATPDELGLDHHHVECYPPCYPVVHGRPALCF